MAVERTRNKIKEKITKLYEKIGLEIKLKRYKNRTGTILLSLSFVNLS